MTQRGRRSGGILGIVTVLVVLAGLVTIWNLTRSATAGPSAESARWPVVSATVTQTELVPCGKCPPWERVRANVETNGTTYETRVNWGEAVGRGGVPVLGFVRFFANLVPPADTPAVGSVVAVRVNPADRGEAVPAVHRAVPDPLPVDVTDSTILFALLGVVLLISVGQLVGTGRGGGRGGRPPRRASR